MIRPLKVGGRSLVPNINADSCRGDDVRSFMSELSLGALSALARLDVRRLLGVVAKPVVRLRVDIVRPLKKADRKGRSSVLILLYACGAA